MEGLEIIHNTDKNFSSLQQEALGQTLCYFMHRKPLNFQYISSNPLKYLHAGIIYFKDKKKKVNLAKGDLVVLPGSQKNQTYIAGQGADGFAIFFKKEKLNNIMYNQLILKELFLESSCSFNENQKILHNINNLCQELFSLLEDVNSSNYDMAIINERLEKGFIQSFLNFHFMNLRRKIFQKPAFLETVRRIAMALDFIHANFHQKINLEDIARNACMSKYCFLRHFKEIFLMTPNEYLINYRLDRAAQLIKLKKKSICAISIDCGFGSPQYFNYTFRKKFGFTPSKLCA